MMITYGLIILSLAIVPTISTAQQSVELGIFDETADWGLEPNFPPQLGNFKIPGRVEVSDVDGNYVYDLYGNGNQVWETSDEAFYTYKTLAGSWSLSGKFKLIDNDGTLWASSGLCIREIGASTNSKFFNFLLRFGNGEKPGDRLIGTYRTQTGGNASAFPGIFDQNGQFIADQGNGIYLRVSRILPLDMYISDWSYDGIHWNFANKIEFPMKENVTYGIGVTNNLDSEGYAHAQISNVKLESCSFIICSRQIVDKQYQPGSTIAVQLQVFNPQDHEQKLSITEHIPEGCVVTEASSDGSITTNAIHWNHNAPPGESILRYSFRIPDVYNEVVHLYGRSGHLPIFGVEFINREREFLTSDNNKGWRFWNMEDGLAEEFSVNVRANRKDHVIVPHGGVNKLSFLDGYEVHSITKPINQFFHIHENNTGQMWVNQNNSLLLYENEEWKEIQIDNLSFETILPYSHNRVLLSNSHHLYEFNAETKQISLIKSATESKLGRFSDLKESLDGNVWMTCHKGLAKIYNSNGIINPDSAWEEYPFDSTFRFNWLNKLHEREKNIVCGVTNSGLYTSHLVCLENGSWKILYSELEQSEYIREGWKDIDNTIWISHRIIDSVRFYLYKIVDGLKILQKYNRVLSGSDLNIDLDQNTNHVFWAGSFGGLARYAPATWRSPNGLRNNNKVILAIHQDQNHRLWFLSPEILFLFENNKWSWFSIPGYSAQWHDSITSLSNGQIAIIAYKEGGAILLFDPATKKFTTIRHPQDPEFNNIYSINGSSFLMGTQLNGTFRIERFDGSQFQMVHEINENISNTEIRSLYLDPNNHCWIGTPKGLWILRDEKIEPFGPSPLSDHVGALVISEVGENKVWVGGRDSIYEYRFEDNEWSPVRTEGLGFISNIIKSEDSSIWVAARTGIHRYRNGSWITNNTEDGLPDATIYTVLEDNLNRIWVGTAVGIYRYHPESDVDPPTMDWNPDQNVQQVSPDGEVSFVFSGKDKWKYTKQERLLYSHRIDDEKWTSFSEETVANFKELPSGLHRFEVKAVDRNWNESEPVVWEFKVLQHWYHNPVILILIGVGGFLLLISSLLHIKQYLNLGKQVQMRTSALQNAYNQLRSLATKLTMTEDRERRKIASDLHDRIGHSLALCRMNVENLQETFQDEKSNQIIEPTIDLLRQTIQDTRNLTFEISPPILYQMGLEKTLEWFVDQFKTQHAINIQFIDDEQEKPLSADKRAFLFRAVRELLFNVVKHANANKAVLSIGRKREMVIVTIEDDGTGFDMEAFWSEEQSDGFGLFSIQEFVKHMGGTLDIDSKLNQGTRIRIIMPLSHTYEES